MPSDVSRASLKMSGDTAHKCTCLIATHVTAVEVQRKQSVFRTSSLSCVETVLINSCIIFFIWRFS